MRENFGGGGDHQRKKEHIARLEMRLKSARRNGMEEEVPFNSQ
jgi:hypothetical protein